MINRIGLGCMGMSEFYGSFDEGESIDTLHKAIDLELNFLTQLICTAGEQMKDYLVKHLKRDGIRWF
jgi:hypothetical protein